MANKIFWKDKRVFLTGHTGFKGSWLALYLKFLGAKVYGYSLPPNTTPSLFEVAKIGSICEQSDFGDIRNLHELKKSIEKANPDIVIHMAAQALVRLSYQSPIETYSVNVVGTATLFEALRQTPGNRVLVNVTTDKCYKNNEWERGYKEQDTLGGFDPYSNSKACSELVTESWRAAFFNPSEYHAHGVALVSARAGNVIGGGDWAQDRLVADALRAYVKDEELVVRNATSIRPWQHVLDAVHGYITLAEVISKKYQSFISPVSGSLAWNFGPEDADCITTEQLIVKLQKAGLSKLRYKLEAQINAVHEATLLKLDCSKAKAELAWKPVWAIDKTVQAVAEWTLAYVQKKQEMQEVCFEQIRKFLQ